MEAVHRVIMFWIIISVIHILFFGAFLENRLIDGDLRRDALALQKSGDWDDAGPQLAEASGGISGGTALRQGAITSQDDEYRWAGVEDPKVMITTSRDPSARLKKFVKVI